jgi:two-component sensor histidine kinase
VKSWRNWIASRLKAARPLPGADANPPATTTTERGWPLRVTLLVWVTFALLPIAVVSILQGLERARIDVNEVDERLQQSARAAAAGEENLLASAEQIARALASISDVRNATANCDAVLGDALIGVKYFSSIARIDKDGTVICAALPASKGRNTAHRAIFQRARGAAGFVVSGQMQSVVLHKPVIAGMLPLRDAKGRFDGVLAITLDIHWLDLLVQAQSPAHGAVVFIYDENHNVLASNNDAAASAILQTTARTSASLHAGSDRAGDAWSYAAAPLREGAINVAFAMRQRNLFGSTYLHVGVDFLMPILMIGLAWAGIWFATERQVTQWISYLRRISAAYRSGHYAIRPQLEQAPSEFRALGDGMSEMADAIQDRDRKLRDALNQKSLLIREIHHRVKNNLQIVMSLLSLQAGQLKDPAARDALMQSQVRINALALVHRILHEIEDQTTIDLKRLLHELAHQITEGMRGERTGVRVMEDLARREVSGDVAVPLALFVVEALTNTFKYAFPPGRNGVISIELKAIADAKLRLEICDDGVGFDEGVRRTGIGTRLIRTFGQQIGGVVTFRTEPDKGTSVSIEFADPKFASQS